MSESMRLRWQLLRGQVSVLAAAHYLMLLRYGFPDLLLRWPITVGRIWRVLFGQPYYALSSFELWLRPYYARLARDFREVGRFGYAWDEGLGLPMGPRPYNNMVTYSLYGALSPRTFSFVAATAYLAAVILAGLAFGNPAQAMLIVLALMASPAFVFSFVGHMIKPEVVWWSLAVIAMAAAFDGAWAFVYVIGGLLLLVNTSVSFILGALLIGPWLWSLVNTGAIPGGYSILLILPGLLKQLWRFAYAYRDGLLSRVAGEQTRFAGERGRRGFTRSDLLYLGVTFWAPLAVASWQRWEVGVMLGIMVGALYIVNSALTKFADSVTILLVFLSSVAAAAITSGEWVSLLGVFMVAYTSPGSYAAGVLGARGAAELTQSQSAELSLKKRIANQQRLLRTYPWLSPIPLPKPPALLKMFSLIPDGSRVLLEGDGEGRAGSRYRFFRNWTDEFLPARKIEFVNHTFLIGLAEPRLAERYLDFFAVPRLTPDELHRVCSELGVSFVIAFTPESTAALQELGYVSVTRVQYQDYAEASDSLRMPPHDLTLLENPVSSDVVFPDVAWERAGNSISWDASAGQTYILRYRFHHNFVARQGQARLTIEAHPVFADLPLRFIKVQAVQDGRLEVEFVPRWI